MLWHISSLGTRTPTSFFFHLLTCFFISTTIFGTLSFNNYKTQITIIVTAWQHDAARSRKLPTINAFTSPFAGIITVNGPGKMDWNNLNTHFWFDRCDVYLLIIEKSLHNKLSGFFAISIPKENIVINVKNLVHQNTICIPFKLINRFTPSFESILVTKE